MLSTLDLFAGCGGLSLGFKNAGFNIIAAFDNWEPAVRVYKENLRDHPIYKLDLKNGRSIDTLKSFRPYVIIGGPPCQDFSSAGKRNESLGRADLTISFANIIKELKPRFFVMENVDRISQSETIKLAFSIFKQSDYGLSCQVLDASLCGVPQYRKRFFIIGERNGTDGFLDGYLFSSLADKPLTVKEYFNGQLQIDYYYRHPWSYRRQAVYSVNEPSPTIRGVNRPIPKGYKGHPNDATSINSGVRPLTIRERGMIQTFPEDFVWEGTKTDLEQMIGNAVPVKLAEYVANCLKHYILDQD